MAAKRVLLTGGSGLLGQELLRIDPNIIAPPRSELDVTNEAQIDAALVRERPDVFIHAAAVVGYDKMRSDMAATLRTNILGTCLVVLACMRYNVRLVYVSTDYVYPGMTGNYVEDAPLDPQGLAGLSKLGGECAARLYPNSLVIRTTFCPRQFPYPFAFQDQYVSKDSVDVIAPIIYELALTDEVGIMNVGTERKSQAELAAKLGAEVPAYSRLDRPDIRVPYDTSMNLSRMRAILARRRTK